MPSRSFFTSGTVLLVLAWGGWKLHSTAASSSIYKSEAGAKTIERQYRGLLDRWPVPNRQLHVSTRLGETFVIECGNPSGRPLLLLHGGGVTSAMWSDAVALWSRDFHIFAIDVIGEPGFSAPSRPSPSSDAYANWLEDTLRALSVEHVSVAGASLGAWIALDFATRHPDRVERLALISPLGLGPQRLSFLFKVLPLSLLGSWGEHRMTKIVVGPGPVDRDLMGFMCTVQENYHPRMVQFPEFPDEALRRLQMPVTIYLGAQDVIIDTAATRARIASVLPGAQVHYQPKSGHGIFDQWTSIEAFLR